MLEANTRIHGKHKGVAEDAGGRSPANGQRRCRMRQREDDAHDVGGNLSPSPHTLVVLVSLHLTLPSTEHVDGLANHGFGKAHVGVPGVDGGKVRLEAADFDRAFLLQITQIAEDMRRLRRKRSHPRARTEILPKFELPRIADPSVGAASGSQQTRCIAHTGKRGQEVAEDGVRQALVPRFHLRVPLNARTMSRVVL